MSLALFTVCAFSDAAAAGLALPNKAMWDKERWPRHGNKFPAWRNADLIGRIA